MTTWQGQLVEGLKELLNEILHRLKLGHLEVETSATFLDKSHISSGKSMGQASRGLSCTR